MSSRFMGSSSHRARLCAKPTAGLGLRALRRATEPGLQHPGASCEAQGATASLSQVITPTTRGWPRNHHPNSQTNSVIVTCSDKPYSLVALVRVLSC
ncbi:exported protein of unknown function [Micropruina glycogenica]|uniref:Uncharacterized protein n=1 Tax=Micropruina glycogenica TaxID=75385 RepID=A0A2N9JG50_9ACTN|nr:exported protein of unknown function [Micropruina glycogenica]